MPADLHAEGIDGVLQQPYRLFNRFRGIQAQQVGSLDEFWSHRKISWTTLPVYSRICCADPSRALSVLRKSSAMNSQRTRMPHGRRRQSGLNHVQADRRYFLKPIPLLVACRFRFNCQPCAEQRQSQPHLGSRTVFLKQKHLPVDFILCLFAAIGREPTGRTPLFRCVRLASAASVFHSQGAKDAIAGHQFVNADCSRLSSDKNSQPQPIV